MYLCQFNFLTTSDYCQEIVTLFSGTLKRRVTQTLASHVRHRSL